MAEPKGFLMVPVGFNPSGDLRALELDANDYLKVALAAWLEGAVDVKGYTGSAWKELLVNASGQAIVVGKGTSEEVNAALLAPARGLVGEHGYVGGAWQKNPLQLGYSAAIGQVKSNTNLAAGTNVLESDTVPVGELWVIQTITFAYVGTSPASVRTDLNNSIVGIALSDIQAPVSGMHYPLSGNWLIAPGGFFGWVVYGATAGDKLYGRGIGYRVDIDL
jgi:hypothetical protein